MFISFSSRQKKQHILCDVADELQSLTVFNDEYYSMQYFCVCGRSVFICE